VTEQDRNAVISRVLEERKDQPGAVLPILHGIQDALGYVPREAIAQIAQALNLSRAEIHGVVSFYHYFRTSPRGRQFAAQHAECVFMSGPSAKIIGPRVAAIRNAASEIGRNPAEILMFSMMTIIGAPRPRYAKYADYRRHIESRRR
jgi:alkanesulfonate monooxygenase SsuD/methylene tetrahydromethanopterin reductase-like flavin-dependent oxidoreductase (luciferase family)